MTIQIINKVTYTLPNHRFILAIVAQPWDERKRTAMSHGRHDACATLPPPCDMPPLPRARIALCLPIALPRLTNQSGQSVRQLHRPRSLSRSFIIHSRASSATHATIVNASWPCDVIVWVKLKIHRKPPRLAWRSTWSSMTTKTGRTRSSSICTLRRRS